MGTCLCGIKLAWKKQTGRRQSQEAVLIVKKKHSFTKTCSIDTILQTLLVGAFDRPEVKDFVTRLSHENPTMDLVAYICKLKKVNGKVYQKRGIILRDIVQKVNPLNVRTLHANFDNVLVDCELNVFDLAQRMLQGLPAFKTSQQCSNKDCSLRGNEWRSIILPNHFLEKQSSEDIVHQLLLMERNCPKNTCSGSVKTTFTSSGPLCIAELEDFYSPVYLENLPKTFQDPVGSGTPDKFMLLGAVSYHGSLEQNSNNVAHYTAICPRQNSWYEYDDLKDEKQEKVKLREKYYIGALIYAKVSK